MKKEKGITLVSLAITIIILLILATVSINVIFNGGLLNRSKNAADKYSEKEICNQIKISYLEYENAVMYQNNLSISEYIKSSLEKTYGEGKVKKVSLKNKKLKITLGEKTYLYDTKTGNVGEYFPINYGTKTKETVQPGDDIIIDETEKFKVISKANNKIMAVPYYNLKLSASPIRQATQAEAAAGQAGTTEFSTADYWDQGIDEIPMEDNRNKIQTYITAYENVLKDIGLENIEVRVGRVNYLLPVMDRNPGGERGFYWIGNTYEGSKYSVRVIESSGGIGNENYNRTYVGVRPIIIIPID